MKNVVKAFVVTPQWRKPFEAWEGCRVETVYASAPKPSACERVYELTITYTVPARRTRTGQAKKGGRK